MSDAPDISVDITPWKYDAQFVYSMTYDEGTIDAIVNSFPIHEEHDIPGHVCTVSGHLGQQRLVRGTSMREVFYMNPEQLRFLINKGWTISSHSHTHVPTGQDGIDLDLEVRLSKWELEKATGQPVRLLAYWGNLRIADKILPVAKEAGYQGILSIGYPFNTSDYDEWAIMPRHYRTRFGRVAPRTIGLALPPHPRRLPGRTQAGDHPRPVAGGHFAHRGGPPPQGQRTGPLEPLHDAVNPGRALAGSARVVGQRSVGDGAGRGGRIHAAAPRRRSDGYVQWRRPSYVHRKP